RGPLLLLYDYVAGGQRVRNGSRMMRWDYDGRRRRVDDYRIIFRVGVVMLLVVVLMTIVGIVAAIESQTYRMIGSGVLIADVGVLVGYLAVNRTVKIIELDAAERRQLAR